MKLWLATHFLFAALFLSSSALTPEECQPMIEPLSLANTSMLLGKTVLISGYVDTPMFKSFMKISDSSWVNVSQTADSKLLFSEGLKINGTCFKVTAMPTVDDTTVMLGFNNHVSVFHVLPGCDGCIVLSANATTTNVTSLLDFLKIASDDIKADDTTELKSRGFYLYSRETTVKDADLERFKQQASCLGFSGEPDFQFDAEKGLCQEGEGIAMM